MIAHCTATCVQPPLNSGQPWVAKTAQGLSLLQICIPRRSATVQLKAWVGDKATPCSRWCCSRRAASTWSSASIRGMGKFAKACARRSNWRLSRVAASTCCRTHGAMARRRSCTNEMMRFTVNRSGSRREKARISTSASGQTQVTSHHQPLVAHAVLPEIRWRQGHPVTSTGGDRQWPHVPLRPQLHACCETSLNAPIHPRQQGRHRD